LNALERIKSAIYGFYRKREGKFNFEVGWNSVFVVVGGGVPKLFDLSVPSSFLLYGLSVLTVATHTFFIKVTKEKRINEAVYWREKARRYSWLTSSIRELIQLKANLMRAGPLPNDFRTQSVGKNMQLLYQFYSHYSEDHDAIGFRVALFLPSDNRTHLYAAYWYYSDGRRPHFQGNPTKQMELFSIPNSRYLAVRAYRDRQTLILETAESIDYMYPGQESFIRSMIAYPIMGGDGQEIVGVITVTADRDGFFRQTEIETHREFIEEIGIRIGFELAMANRIVVNE
jgi:hypothetical protein